jgi:hypothetical protein
MRWLWFSRVDDGRAWSGLDLKFTHEEKEFFFASTHMTIGNGQRTLFWEDRWIDGRAVREIAPLLYDCIPKRRRRTRTVANGLPANRWARDIQGVIGLQEIGQYLQLWHLIEHTALTEDPDTLIWKWTTNGVYSAHSAYLASFHGAITCANWRLNWRTWAPPKVKFFQWLANLDRCWTADRLARRGLQHPPRCPLCDQEAETIKHLMLECPLSRQVWHETIAWLRIPCLPPDGEDTLNDWWRSARHGTPKQMHKGLASVALLVPWMVWKHRNECIFDGIQPSFHALMTKIKNEASMWARAGALGLRAILPQTWDVH